MKMMRRISLLLALSLLLLPCLSGCSLVKGDLGKDLMQGVVPVSAVERETDDVFADALTDFGIKLFLSQRKDGKSVLVSPLSVYIALSMTAGGAEGDTLREMETVLGLPAEMLHQYLKTYTDNLSSSEKAKLSIANSLWFRDDDRLSVSGDFLALNGGYYGAEVRKVPFDRSTVKAVNQWVKEKTDGMIEKLAGDDTFTERTMFCLINALAFDAKWSTPYEEDQVRDAVFHAPGGDRTVEMMYETGASFLESENATGFIKSYEGGRYALMAILPKEDVDFDSYAAAFDAGEYGTLWNSRLSSADYSVYTGLPKFSMEYENDLSAALAAMGMPTAFDDSGVADFTAMVAPESAVQDLYISSVIHKTYIELGEAGTKAAAVTAVIMTECTGYDPGAKEQKEVILDRPFLYAIVDTKAGIPLFFGAVTNIE